MQVKINAYIAACFEQYWDDVEMRDDDGNKILDLKGLCRTKPVKKWKMVHPPTVSGMCVFLGMTRQGLHNYKDKPEFVDTIKRALSLIESSFEEGLADGRINPTAGIFIMKNNFGWKDKSEVDNNIKVEEVKAINYTAPNQIEAKSEAKVIDAPVMEKIIIDVASPIKENGNQPTTNA